MSSRDSPTPGAPWLAGKSTEVATSNLGNYTLMGEYCQMPNCIIRI